MDHRALWASPFPDLISAFRNPQSTLFKWGFFTIGKLGLDGLDTVWGVWNQARNSGNSILIIFLFLKISIGRLVPELVFRGWKSGLDGLETVWGVWNQVKISGNSILNTFLFWKMFYCKQIPWSRTCASWEDQLRLRSRPDIIEADRPTRRSSRLRTLQHASRENRPHRWESTMLFRGQQTISFQATLCCFHNATEQPLSVCMCILRGYTWKNITIKSTFYVWFLKFTLNGNQSLAVVGFFGQSKVCLLELLLCSPASLSRGRRPSTPWTGSPPLTTQTQPPLTQGGWWIEGALDVPGREGGNCGTRGLPRKFILARFVFCFWFFVLVQ